MDWDRLRETVSQSLNRKETLLALWSGDNSCHVATWRAGDTARVSESTIGPGPFIRPSTYGYWGLWGLEEEAPPGLWHGPRQRLRVTGRGTHLMPLGPVRADVAESIRYELAVFGDDIHGLRLYPGYKRRHVVQLMTGQSVDRALALAERITGTSPVAHAWAFSQAVEDAWDLQVPEPAAQFRTVLAELERLASHLGDLALLASSTGTVTAAADLYRQKEAVLRFNALLTGHRYLRGFVSPGGIRRAPHAGSADLAAMLDAVEREFASIRQALERTNSFLDRLHGAGQIPADQLSGLDLTGFVAKAAGMRADLRWDRPYGAYGALVAEREPCRVTQPDAFGRYWVRAEEVAQSVQFLRRLAWPRTTDAQFLSAPVNREEPGVGYGLVEAPRGRLFYRIEAAGDTVRHAVIDTASRRNWPAVPFAMAARNIMQDFPIIDASFALAVSSLDL
jgi:Ni,Fe-hydrogenase III large subunit